MDARRTVPETKAHGGDGGRDVAGPLACHDRIRLVIVEDHEMIAEGLRVGLQAAGDLDVLAIATTLADGEQVVRSTVPDVVLMDFHLPDGEASDLIRRLRERQVPSRSLVISGSADSRSVLRALESGADGYLLKDQPITDLLAGIRMVHRGQQVVSPTLLPKLVARLADSATDAHLSSREIEVLQLLADGLSTRELAGHLHLSIHTVRNHIQRIMLHLGAHSRLEAVSIALRDGMISTPSYAAH